MDLATGIQWMEPVPWFQGWALPGWPPLSGFDDPAVVVGSSSAIEGLAWLSPTFPILWIGPRGDQPPGP